MPGGRLTQQERQQIAWGPADGLAYAEIARRLDRPTSTITREVMRNGGPTAYRADLAHRATERRTQRRRQTAPRGPETSPQPHGTLTDSGSLAASELARHFEVGPASVSKVVAFLDSQGLVRRERGERRRERYVVVDDIWYQAMMAGARSTAQLVENARQGVGILGPGTPAAARLESIVRFLDYVSESFTRAAEQVREFLHTKSESAPDSTA
ncbi:helix-turn-helix domain-containing protein [Streptomyces sp. NPDC054863]